MVRLPVVVLLASVIVSVVIATDSDEALPLTMPIIVQIGNALELFAGIVSVKLAPFM